MTSLAYEILIVSRPGECPYGPLGRQVAYHVELVELSIVVAWADAMVLGDARLRPTNDPDRFQFDGDRVDFDDWMAARRPQVDYRWLDHLIAAFVNRTAKQIFEREFGDRILRMRHLSRPVDAGPRRCAERSDDGGVGGSAQPIPGG